ncbi:hypothetical protein M5K25_021049 [Dendrobium thyrsiflorum]|uniref:RNase H type-1 domain-containing protein n=1 Tax=Dendrobium thyrsiflorum TaxID=117978 RepID=A0ABD0UBD0_DENTH
MTDEGAWTIRSEHQSPISGLEGVLRTEPSGDSKVWQRLCKVKWAVEPFISWGLGVGDIFFWQDRWLGDHSIDSIINASSTTAVKDYEKLANAIFDSIIQNILNHPLNTDSDDLLLGDLSKDGGFRLKDSWHAFRSKNEVTNIFLCFGIKALSEMVSLLSFRGIYDWIGIILFSMVLNVKDKVLALYSVKLISVKEFKNYPFVASDLGLKWEVDHPSTEPSIGSSSGCGGVIRDNNDNFIMAFADPLQICDINCVVISTILHGLRLCISLDLTNIGIEVDSNYNFQFLHSVDDTVSNPAIFYLVRDIKNLLIFMNYSFSHVYKEGNLF